MDIPEAEPKSDSAPETAPAPESAVEPLMEPRKEMRRKPRSPRVFLTTLLTAMIVATMFVAFTPNSFSGGITDQLNAFLTPEPNSVGVAGAAHPSVKIGIVSGHLGNDSGTVCDNGTTEQEVNLKIATLFSNVCRRWVLRRTCSRNLTHACKVIARQCWFPYTTIPANTSMIRLQVSRWRQP